MPNGIVRPLLLKTLTKQVKVVLSKIICFRRSGAVYFISAHPKRMFHAQEATFEAEDDRFMP